MIPRVAELVGKTIKFTDQPSLTYRMDLSKNVIRGSVDGLDAVRQAVYKILQTERYQYVIYSWNYGVEFSDLFGEPVSYVCPELKRRITEALTWDKRILDVHNFRFDTSKRGAVHVSFTVKTIYGEIEAEREVQL